MRILFILCFLWSCAAPAAAWPAVRKVKGASAVVRNMENTLRRTITRWQAPKVRVPVSCPFLKTGVPRADAAQLQGLRVILPSLALPLDENGDLLGSGFVLRAASGRLYAVTSYHVAGSAGKPSGVLLFSPEKGPVTYHNLQVSSGGMYGVNAPDVSLIELPPEVQKFVHPLDVAPAAPKSGTRLFMWGRPYDADGFSLVRNLYVEDSYGMKTVMHPSDDIEFLEGMCGSPVLNDEGLVVGVYGGRGKGEGDMFAIDARKSLNWLLQNYETKTVSPYIFKMLGHTALELFPGENVGRVRHTAFDGSLLEEIDLPVYRARFDAERMEELFRDLRSGDIIEFEILKKRFPVRWVMFKVP